MNINSPPENLNILSKNIKFERNRRGLSQRDLATSLGFKGTSTVTFWEKGDNYPPLETFLQLCKFFERDPNEMLCKDLTALQPEPEQPPPKEGKGTEGVEALQRHVEKELQEMDVGGVSKAAESPPSEKTEIQKMKKQMLEMMLKLEDMDAPK